MSEGAASRTPAPKAGVKAKARPRPKATPRALPALQPTGRPLRVLGVIAKPMSDTHREARTWLLEHPQTDTDTFAGLGNDKSWQRVERPVPEHEAKFKRDLANVRQTYIMWIESPKLSPNVGWWRFLVLKLLLLNTC